MNRSFEEKERAIKNEGGFYIPVTYEDMQTPKLWAYVLAQLERYDQQITFEYKESAEISFTRLSMKANFIQLGCIDKINTSFIWHYNEEMPIGTMFIYENGRLKNNA